MALLHNSYHDRHLGFFVTAPYFTDRPNNASISEEIIQDETSVANMTFNDVTWVASHNAHANNFAAGGDIVKQMAANQEFSIYKQLKEVGVRGLLLDIKYSNNRIMLVHGLVEYGRLDEIINEEIIPFLEEDSDAIITIDLEILGNRELIMKELRVILYQTTGFSRRMFRLADDRWKNHIEWPTIQELRDTDQRVIVLSDSTIVQSEELGIMLRDRIVLENHWLKGLDKCSPRNENVEDYDTPWKPRHIGGKTWSRLFTLNHFCCVTGIQSFERVKPENIGGGDNGWGILYPRIEMCMVENGHSLKPNFIAVDWSHIGRVMVKRAACFFHQSNLLI